MYGITNKDGGIVIYNFALQFFVKMLLIKNLNEMLSYIINKSIFKNKERIFHQYLKNCNLSYRREEKSIFKKMTDKG